MQINITWDPTADNAPAGFKAAVQAAVAYFDTEITSPITVSIQFSWGRINGKALDSNAVGESVSNGFDFSYAQVLGALTASATSADDATAISSLPRTDPTNGGQFFIASAEAKALGLDRANASGLDGYVALSNTASFTFDPNNRAVSGLYDAIGVLEHEISEVLGRMAGLGQDMTGSTPEYSALDLFRYSGAGVRDLNPDAAYFSLDGRTMLSAFNNGTRNGGDDGDWAASASSDSFDAFASLGQEGTVSATDLRVMDVLGYALQASSPPVNLIASAPSAALVEAGVTPAGQPTLGVATSKVDLTPSGGDSPTYVLTSWTTLGSGLYSQTGTYGSVVLDTVHNTLIYTLDNSAPATLALGVGVTATDNFRVAIADAFTTASVPVSFSVTGTDVDPTVPGHSFSIALGAPLVESGAALLAGAADVKGEPLQVSAVGDATHGSVVLDGRGDAVFTPDAGYIGLASYDYTVSDGHGGAATATVKVYVDSPAGGDDFDGGPTSDVMFRQVSTGDWGYMTANASGGETWRPVGPSSTGYDVIGKGDFNGDGRSDIAFRNTATGDWGYMSLDPSGAEVWRAVGPTSLAYTAIGVGDFNGDGHVDIAFRNTATGGWGFMTPDASGGETWRDVGPTSTAYVPVGVGDFDGGGRDEIAFRNPTSGDFGFMSVTASGTEVWHPIGPTSPDYAAAGVGDFNGDGLLDVAFRQTATGDWGFMTINPAGGETWRAVGPTSTAYDVIGAADYNGDGRTDLAFRNKAGDWGFMSVNGSGQEVWHPVGPTSTDYKAL